jgi:hypothetical protein
VKRRYPEDFDWDRLELECGHTVGTIAGTPDVKSRECRDCIEAWMLRRARAGKK